MNKKSFFVPTLWITIANLLIKLNSEIVQCPDNANFTSCIQCYRYTQRDEPLCNCYEYQFSILNKCFKPAYPCSSSLLSYIYDDAYRERNLWTTTIAPFWQGQFQSRKNFLGSSILKKIDFSNMGLDQKRDWTQAYYLYVILIKDLDLNNQTKTQLLIDSIQFAESISELDSSNKWYQLSKFYNRRLQKNLTLNQFYNFIKQKAKLIAPCHSCQKMYGIIQQGGTTRCSKCTSNCLTCENNTSTCTLCLQGYLLRDGLCEQCNMIGGCRQCSSRSMCIRCWDGKTYSSGYDRCLNCIEECVTCFRGATSLCQMCNQMIFNALPGDHGRCFTCNNVECKDCDQRRRNECYECHNGYYLVKKVCVPCQPFCLKCDKFGCLQCEYGYGLIEGLCQVCSTPGCLSCNSNKDSCSACVSPYFQFNDQTLTCKLMNVSETAKSFYKQGIHCRPGCNYCYDNNTDLCYNCADRYFIKDQYCYKCMPGCIKCSSLRTCKQCTSGYGFYQDRTCLPCPPNCRKCYDLNISHCFDCRHGFSLENGTCVESLTPQCLFFSTANISECHLCLPGHTLNSQKKCIKCEMSCNQTCQPTNISACRRSKLVIGKSFNFRHGYKNIGCKAEINGHCVLPETGYRLQKNVKDIIVAKMKCLYPCKTCQKETCLSCESEYILQFGKCAFNDSCNPTCKNCPAGTERNSSTNMCVKCQLENCAVCRDGECLECHEGYFYDPKVDKICKPCPSKCRKCYDERNCRDCSEGYFFPIEYGVNLNPYDCIKCSQNCLTCKYWPGFCISCPPGTRIMNFRCIKQYYVAYRYIFDANYTNFTLNAESEDFISSAIKMVNASYEDIFISVKEGSTIIQGYVSALNQARALQIYNTMKKETLPNWKYPLLGSSFSFMNETKVIECESFGKDSCQNQKKGLSIVKIVLIVVGVICSLLLTSLVIYCYCKRKKSDAEQEQEKNLHNQIQTQVPDSENNFPVVKNQKIEVGNQNQK